MPTVERTFAVEATPVAVVGYLKDFAHAEEWDPGTDTCVRLDDGPLGVGARWQNTSTIMGVHTELEYTLEEVAPDRIVLVGRNDTATSTDTIIVGPHAGGSQITYRAELEMHGLAKIASPAMKLVFEKLGHDTEQQLTEVLNRLDGRSSLGQ